MEQASEATDTKTSLLKHIEQNPGIRYRELSRMTGLVNGVLTYHLSALEKTGAVRADRQSGATHYYPISVSDKESTILKYVRHEPVRKILLFILDHELCTFAEIVAHTGKAPSTISSHLKRLREAGVIVVRFGEYQLFKLADRELVSEVLSKYRRSFVDRVVDDYTEIVEEL